MAETKRFRRAINWLISQGKFSSQKEIGEKMGITNRSYLSQLVNAATPSVEIVNKFTEIAPEISVSWLLTGEGEMLNNSEKPDTQANVPTSDYRLVPLVNIDSVGGLHSTNLIDNSEQYIIKMMPFSEAREGDVAILQTGNSMYPTIPAGSALLIREVADWREYFGYGNIYVLLLRDGRRITKEVRRYDSDPDNYVWCVSYNPDVADEELPKSMIRSVYKVVKYLADFGW